MKINDILICIYIKKKNYVTAYLFPEVNIISTLNAQVTTRNKLENSKKMFFFRNFFICMIDDNFILKWFCKIILYSNLPEVINPLTQASIK